MTDVGRSGQRPSSDVVGNDARVPCHKSIVESYATAMGRTSDPALLCDQRLRQTMMSGRRA